MYLKKKKAPSLFPEFLTIWCTLIPTQLPGPMDRPWSPCVTGAPKPIWQQCLVGLSSLPLQWGHEEPCCSPRTKPYHCSLGFKHVFIMWCTKARLCSVGAHGLGASW